MMNKNWWILPTGVISVISALTGGIFKMQNDKIKTVEAKVDLEVEDRKAENKDQYNKINVMQRTVDKTGERVKLIALKLGVEVGED